MREGMHRDVQLLAGALDQHLMHARRNGRQEFAIGRGAKAFVRAGDADEFFGFVVPGRHFVVGDGPVEAEAVELLRLEIVIGETQRDAAVVIGAAAEDARAEPAEFFARGDGVGFAGDIPIAVGSAPVAPLLLAEVGFGVGAGTAMVDVPGPDVLFEILRPD